jgi:hypothetical protein
MNLLEVGESEAGDFPHGAQSWSPKQELGHLIDSAANNHIRFVRAALEGEFHGPGYAQDEWVKLHGYQGMPWEAIIGLWLHYNTLLARLVARIPPARLQTQCFIGSGTPVTLAFLIEDYVVHMQHHLDHLLRRAKITIYPSATTQLMPET